jgi:hypothetical protein
MATISEIINGATDFLFLQKFKKVFKNGTRKNRFMLDFSYVDKTWASALISPTGDGIADNLKFLVKGTGLKGKSVKSNDREFQGMKTFYSGDSEPITGFKATFLSDIDGIAYNFCEAWLNAKKNNITNTYGAKEDIESVLVAWQLNDKGEKIGAWVMFGAVINESGDMDKDQATGDFEEFDATFDIEFREVIRGEGATLQSAVDAFITAYLAL